jgi:hypothetical protein
VKINSRPSLIFVAILVISASVPLAVCAQMASPSKVTPSNTQPGQPSSDAAKPTGAIGLSGSGTATEITPEGYLRTGFEEFLFFVGARLEPTNAHTPKLEQGQLPIVHYEITREGITYRFTIFAGKIDKSAIIEARRHAKFPFPPGFDIESGIIEPHVNFVRVEITNSASEPKQAVFASGVRYQDPNATGASKAGNSDLGEPFDPNWRNSFDDANFYRYNRDLYNFPAGYADRSFTVRKNWSEQNPQDILAQTRLDPAPTTPIGIVTYARELKPGESWTLDFKMLLIPNADPFVISAIDDASFDAIEAQMRGAQMHGEPHAQH